MTELDVVWIKEQLQKFIKDAKPRNLSNGGFITPRNGPTASEADILAQLETIEPILDRLYPEWRRTMPLSTRYRFSQQFEGAQRCLARLERQAEVEERLGGRAAPQLGADELHPWVWDPARPQWESGHFGAAVTAACNNLNSRLQQRLGRRDVSNTDLALQTFSLDDAKPGVPRIRVLDRDDSETYKSMQDGVKFMTAGCFLAIRNVLAHLPGDDPRANLSRQEALERLAALSLTARWIEGGSLEVVESD